MTCSFETRDEKNFKFNLNIDANLLNGKQPQTFKTDFGCPLIIINATLSWPRIPVVWSEQKKTI